MKAGAGAATHPPTFQHCPQLIPPYALTQGHPLPMLML